MTAQRCLHWRILTIGICWVMLLLLLSEAVMARHGPTPEIASTILQMHKLYMTSPPHDTKLYDILHVTPNATAAMITKSYRNLVRRYHPDKTTMDQSSTLLQQIQDAYDILKDDSTRLPYHQYGLTDPNVAVAILLGPHHQNRCNHLLDEAHHELLQLMGYEFFSSNLDPSSKISLDVQRRQQERIRFVAARLVERLRPLIEESVDPSLVAHQLKRECDQWKRLPLGAQVIRCVGRAYRHAGQDFLQRHYSQKQQSSNLSVVDYYSVPVRQQWRKAKAFWTAVLATGKATVTEKVWDKQEKRRRFLKEKAKKRTDPSTAQIDYLSEGFGELDFLNKDYESDASDIYTDFSSDDDDDEDSEEERKYIEQFRAKQTILTSLQVEALWKVAKIDLDRVIRRACRLILTQEYFFFPSHQTLIDDHVDIPPTHGWVTSRGEIMNADDALQRTARALVFFGDIMVERSKLDTSWKA